MLIIFLICSYIVNMPYCLISTKLLKYDPEDTIITPNANIGRTAVLIGILDYMIGNRPAVPAATLPRL